MKGSTLAWTTSLLAAFGAAAGEPKLSDVYLRIGEHEERIGALFGRESHDFIATDPTWIDGSCRRLFLPIRDNELGETPGGIARALAESSWTEQFASATNADDCATDAVEFFTPQELSYNGNAALREFFAHFRAWRLDPSVEREKLTVRFESDEFRDCDWASRDVRVLAASEYGISLEHPATRLHLGVVGCGQGSPEKLGFEVTWHIGTRRMDVVVGPPPTPVP